MRLSIAALLFYLAVFILWTLNIIPAPSEIFLFLESLYNSIGLAGVFISVLIESILFLGLYFPGSFILVIALLLSSGTLGEFILLSSTTALALTIGSIINYNLGKYRLLDVSAPTMPSRFFFLVTFLHPNFMAFYFYSQGLQGQNFSKIMYVPLFIVPYGTFLSFMIYSVIEQFQSVVENSYFVITLLFLWVISSYILTIYKKTKPARANRKT